MELLRSLLFVPGNRRDMLEKARNLPTDALVPDMEDSVPMTEKAQAREAVADLLPRLAGRGQRIIPRTNSLNSGLLEEDLAAVVGPHVFGVSVGKTESAWQITQIEAILTKLEKKAGLAPGTVKLLPWIETSLAVVNAYELCKASPRIVAVAFGAGDFTADMGIQQSEEFGEETLQLLYARSAVTIAARAAGVASVDTPCINFRDAERLKQEVKRARQLGFTGKFAIHPNQLETINAFFAPSPQEVEYARRVVQASEEAEAQGRGATSLEGRMIDAPVVKRARSVLALAEAIRRATGDQ